MASIPLTKNPNRSPSLSPQSSPSLSLQSPPSFSPVATSPSMAEKDSPFSFSSESDLPTPICETANFDPHYDYSAELLWLEQLEKGSLSFNTVVPETPNLDLVGEMAENPDLGERAEKPDLGERAETLEGDIVGDVDAVVDYQNAPYRGPVSIEFRRFIRKDLGHWFPSTNLLLGPK